MTATNPHTDQQAFGAQEIADAKCRGVAEYRQTEAFILVVGPIWMSRNLYAKRVNLTAWDLATLGEFTRESVAAWLCSHSQNVGRVSDFYVSTRDAELPWATAEGETAYRASIGEE